MESREAPNMELGNNGEVEDSLGTYNTAGSQRTHRTDEHVGDHIRSERAPPAQVDVPILDTDSDPIQPCCSRAPTVKYIRDESSLTHFSDEGLMPYKPYTSPCDEVEFSHNDSGRSGEHFDSWGCEIDDTVDPDMYRRCLAFMKGLRCHKGEYCNNIHRLPKEDGVVCADFKAGCCSRPASLCWFRHLGVHSETFVTPSDAPCLVQPVAGLVQYLRNEEKSHPGKYTKGWKE